MFKRGERSRVILFALTAITATLCSLTACAMPAPNTPPTPNLFNLANSKWILTAMTENSAARALVAPAPSLNFEVNTLGGNSSCNTYGGAFKTQGEIITVSMLQVTAMACADDKAMAQESAYLDALQNARVFELRDNRLSIIYGEGTGQLVFERAQ